MSFLDEEMPSDSMDALLDRLSVDAAVQANCAFQLALMVARISLQPGSEAFNEESANVLMDLMRSRPRSNVVPLFRSVPDGREAGAPRHTFASGPSLSR